MGGWPGRIPTDTARALIEYISEGMRVFPVYEINEDGKCSCGRECGPKNAGKHPRIADWQKEATTKFNKVKGWWQRWPNANIGVATGEGSQGFVIDIDSWDAWQDLGQELPETYTYVTPRGGRHLWFNYPEEQKITNSRGSLPHGIDVRGTGGFVLMPPSRTLKGQYRDAQKRERADAPAWLLNALSALSEPDRGILVDERECLAFGDLDLEMRERVRLYVQRALSYEIENLIDLTEETGIEWNNTTYQVACNLYELAKAPWSYLTQSEVDEAVRENIPPYDDEGWNEVVIDKLLDSAYKRIFHNPGVRPFPDLKNLPTTPKSGENGSKNKEEIAPLNPELDIHDLILTPIADIAIEKTEWLWTNRIPLGEITLFAGQEGVGKSVIAAWISAQVTKGLFEGDLTGVSKNVIYLATEDSWSKTIVPRLTVAGADPHKVFQARVNNEYSLFDLPTYVPQLKKAVLANNIGLIVLDPLVSFLASNVNNYKDTEVRRALEPLSQMAQETNCAIVGLAHHGKGHNDNMLDKILGSKAFTQVCRQVLQIAVNDDGDCFFGNGKQNLAPSGQPSLKYQIVSRDVLTTKGMSNAGAVLFSGEVNMHIKDIFNQTHQSESVKDAGEWLIEILTDYKAMWVNDIYSQGQRHGFKAYELREARKTKGIEKGKAGGTGVPWFWYYGITEDQAKNLMSKSTKQHAKEQIKGLGTDLEF